MAILSADGPTAGMQDYDTSALPSHLIFYRIIPREPGTDSSVRFRELAVSAGEGPRHLLGTRYFF